MGRSRMLSFINICLDTAVWKSANRQLLIRQLVAHNSNKNAGFSDHDHLMAAAGWLKSAQDATKDGGIAGRYTLANGWTSSYPETTGYIIPTLLQLAEFLGDNQYVERTRKCVSFLLSVQLENGAFPGLEIAENRTVPSIFNSAQIICGLLAWYKATNDDSALNSAIRAADWVVSQQDADGGWRKHIYGSVRDYTYMAHAACWIAELGEFLGNIVYLNAAQRHLEWVLSHYDETIGWFDKSGFFEENHKSRTSVTHTLAYTLWGVLMLSEILKNERGLQSVKTTARHVARRLELSRWLPGVLDCNYRKQAAYTCLTGNAQMALVWFKLHRMYHDLPLVNAAFKALDLVKMAQPMYSLEPGIQGGVPGSWPIWGDYLYAAIPNWSAKFFIDALLEKQLILAELSLPQAAEVSALPNDIPTEIPKTPGMHFSGNCRVVMYTSPYSTKVHEMVSQWKNWEFKPTCVFVETPSEPSIIARISNKIVSDGGMATFKRLVTGKADIPVESCTSTKSSYEPALDFCRNNSIPLVEVDSFESTETLTKIRKLAPDLAIHAGAGILRKELLSIPKLGTLNAHMGILPHFRGMNVAEWSRLLGAVVGCTVHLIDTDIDTGAIICRMPVPVHNVTSIAELREAVDKAQISLLGQVVRYVVSSGQLPKTFINPHEEGRQYFRLHEELRTFLDQKLSGA
jgi:folate-dependent phosphoribosylglycinamide formyltransferase PurN